MVVLVLDTAADMVEVGMVVEDTEVVVATEILPVANHPGGRLTTFSLPSLLQQYLGLVHLFICRDDASLHWTRCFFPLRSTS
jgi:hypothetical protein